MTFPGSQFVKSLGPKNAEATVLLTWVALFLGELRDGLTMINMQSAYLLVSKNYSEKQVGVLFFVFGMSQFLFQAPAGYIMDYTHKKTLVLSVVGIGTTLCTILTALWAKENGNNLGLMIFIKFVQGALTALIPTGLNSITQGIVGSVGMTSQVSKNEMMNHLGTSVIVVTASIIAYFKYPDIGIMFIVSPLACFGTVLFLNRIKPEHIDHDAARGLKTQSETPNYIASKSGVLDGTNDVQKTEQPTSPAVKPSFNVGFGQAPPENTPGTTPLALTPLQVLKDPILIIFTVICFLFHMANGCILPLVMQTLAIGNGNSGILMSGLCIVVAQLCMVVAAKICGDYSGKYGRKILFLVGLFIVSIRCAIILGFLRLREIYQSNLIEGLILSTQIMDGVGAGVFGTMYILVTSDISGGTGRFSMTLGITSAAMSIGGTVSGYLGEWLAEDFGYDHAFFVLGLLSLIPALLYLFAMPETLADCTSDVNMSSSNNCSRMESIVEENDTSYKQIT
mmetsp:Transcript_37960/g.88323  ORF Transcript_37960/g.88323 Transcript_37960/m.88323 type:complete len:509 (-) Transcript_37960:112-1638(-)|eukprot:CAMPEP_0113303256 /NCGR_PEP_ID=MMETSP0010_2-20120614/3749_1 /TAXON_ID=216773 ORGANISM="Corethron hystrix, Strain 308" /NCGR_SAMPLE_ID=MMETSP0010_2 /ASSEMBLY_ACC=CAM_ASM_000155 /LENGTH=508 /DNA_ID=CAMNT_0000157225 /DNA_START=293 /DNA_END=1819 /DNA_ORIENTATION=- /assembly_acc=CAM_ASM_000155